MLHIYLTRKAECIPIFTVYLVFQHILYGVFLGMCFRQLKNRLQIQIYTIGIMRDVLKVNFLGVG